MADWEVADKSWGVRALDFVDAVEKARTAEEVTALFAKMIAEVGFDAYAMIGLPDSQTPFSKRVLANGWPREWSEVYTKENLCEVDPVARHCMRTVNPFDWCEAPYNPERHPRAQAVMQRATDFGMSEGLCVPIHYGDGTGAAVTMAGQRVELARGVRSALVLMAMYAHNRIRSFAARPSEQAEPLLTEREREVVSWVAAGKSNWEISVILHIAERTVRFHIESSARKLNAVNRASLIKQAMALREISL
jgi:LuxR family quorum sensing-dependent transcriptional regulator